LYCTARAQHVMPRRRDHAVESGRRKPIQVFAIMLPASVSGMTRGKPNRERDTLALNLHWPRRGARRHPPPAWWSTAIPGGLPLLPYRIVSPGANSRGPTAALVIAVPVEASASAVPCQI